MNKRLDAVTFKQLRALQAVSGLGTIAAASESLGLTPPAVHNQLKMLEEILSCRMLERAERGAFEPTPEGRILLNAFSQTQSVLQRAIHQIDALSLGQSGAVMLGVVSTAKYFAPAIVAGLRRDLPDIDVVLKVGNRGKIISAISARELDLVIMGRPPRMPEVVAHGMGEHPHVLVAGPENPLAGNMDVTADDILSNHFVMREEGSGTRILCTRFLDELGQGREVPFTEMDSNETIKQAVISGLGIALLSAHTVTEELRHGRLVEIPFRGLPIMRHWFIVHRADEMPEKATLTVLDWMRQHAAAYLKR